jgi:translation initiation factor IF-2
VDETVAAEVEIVGLKRGPQDVKEVLEGEMCGMNIKTENRLELVEGDRIELFTRETVARSL